MPITFTPEERAEILRLANEAVEIRDQYWDKLHELETSLGFDVDELDSILEGCPSEDCSDEEFTDFIKTCTDSSELLDDEEDDDE